MNCEMHRTYIMRIFQAVEAPSVVDLQNFQTSLIKYSVMNGENKLFFVHGKYLSSGGAQSS